MALETEMILFLREFLDQGSGFSCEVKFSLRNYLLIQLAHTNCLILPLIDIQTYA